MAPLDAAGVAPRPFAGLYDFVKTHLVVVNGVVLASTTFVGAMDFLAPRLSVVPTVVYSATGFVVLLMLVAALAPAGMCRLLAALGLARPSGAAPALWRRPAWQFSVAILLAVTILGFASVARASEGGIIAGKFPEARRLQESLLALGRDAADIKRGVADANGKLDALMSDSKDTQREVVARGYPYDAHGVTMAIKQADLRAVRLFAQAGLALADRVPMLNLLNGDQPWNAEIAAALPRAMFANPTSCDDAGMLGGEIKEPASERILLYKRLCGADKAVATLRERIARDLAGPARGDYEQRQRIARASNLALLEK